MAKFIVDFTHDDIQRAAEFAKKYHKDQMYGDRPYHYHLVMVDIKVQELFGQTFRNSGELYFLRVCAFLHDVIEDTDADFNEIENEFGLAVADTVALLTRFDGETKEHYLDELVLDPFAVMVKIADTLSNLEHSIMAGNTRRINKYRKQLSFLLKHHNRHLGAV